MLLTHLVLTLLTAWAGFCLVVEARQCPPPGPVLPPPKRPSQHPAVKSAIEGIIKSLEAETAGFNYSAVSVAVRSIHEDEPFLNFHHTPPHPDSKRGAKEVDASTVYRLGSVSKVFTVLAALKLAEDGLLSMDDPVGQWIPELSGRAGNPGSEDELDEMMWQDVTVEDVAAHLAGIGGDMTSDLASFEADWEGLGLPKAVPETKARACSGLLGQWGASPLHPQSAGGMNSNTEDLIAFMVGILKNSALSPSSTRRWFKPASFLSVWSNAVGAPWEIYRVDNLTADGRIIDLYTKGGSLTSYFSGLSLVPDLGFVISVLSAGPEVMGLWPSLASLKAMEALIPAMNLAAKDEAKKRFAGTYTDKDSGSRLMLSLDDGPGLVLSDWVIRDFDVLPNLGRYNPATMNDTTESNLTSIRMFPTGLETERRSAWRATFPAFTDEQAKIIDSSTSVRDASCVTWRMVDRLIYNDVSMDHFEFQFGEDGETAKSIKCKGFDVEMTRVADESQGSAQKMFVRP
ncbi:hypothetical protein ACHAPT_012271 [Fusarium lateritium]